MHLVDSHCHLNFPDFDGRIEEILENCRNNDVHHLLCISTSWENQQDVLKLSADHAPIYAAIGKHPTTEGGFEPTAEDLLEAAKIDKVVAIGETGLDYFRSSGDLAWQHERFHHHIEAARQCKKPLIIHTRAAAEDTMQTLRDKQAQDAGGVMHCFAEDWDIAKQALDIGFYISFSGIVTFKRNEPSYVRHTAEFVAQLRGIELEELAEATTKNFFNLFSDANNLKAS